MTSEITPPLNNSANDALDDAAAAYRNLHLYCRVVEEQFNITLQDAAAAALAASSNSAALAVVTKERDALNAELTRVKSALVAATGAAAAAEDHVKERDAKLAAADERQQKLRAAVDALKQQSDKLPLLKAAYEKLRSEKVAADESLRSTSAELSGRNSALMRQVEELAQRLDECRLTMFRDANARRAQEDALTRRADEAASLRQLLRASQDTESALRSDLRVAAATADAAAAAATADRQDLIQQIERLRVENAKMKPMEEMLQQMMLDMETAHLRVELANERVLTSANASGSTDQNVFISLFALPESEVFEEKQQCNCDKKSGWLYVGREFLGFAEEDAKHNLQVVFKIHVRDIVYIVRETHKSLLLMGIGKSGTSSSMTIKTSGQVDYKLFGLKSRKQVCVLLNTMAGRLQPPHTIPIGEKQQ